MATLTEIQNRLAKNAVSSPTNSLLSGGLTAAQQEASLTRYAREQEERAKNQGGFFGGIGYAFEKLGLGFLQSIEGIWDFAAGGLADLFGAHDWAEQQIANDWVNYNDADEWFNPSDGWKVVGDVTGGIGTSLPAIATVAVAAAITYFSGGTLAPAAAGLIGGAVAGLGAAGTATKQAYQETGELTGKEWGYGALSGFTEGAMEGVSDAIGFGVGAIAKNLAKSTAKEGAVQIGKSIAKSAARQTFAKTIVSSFLSEAFEEGVQEMLDPVFKRITYDPNAENATFQQVAYAALVGGLSGAIMGGADVSVRNSINYFSGSRINSNGGSTGVIDLAQAIADTEGVNQSGNAQVDFVVNTLEELQTSLKKTNGEVRTPKQKMLVGILSKANTAAPLSIIVHQNADSIINDAQTTAQRLNDIGYKTSKGETVTAEMLTEGITGERGTREYRKSLSAALQTNEALRTVAVMSAAGQLNMDAARFSDSVLRSKRGETLANQADLNHFLETATDAQKRDVGERLGIKDWDSVTMDELKARIKEFSENGGVDQYINERNEVKKLRELEISKKGLPKYVGSITQDGAVRYKFGDASVAIVKEGNTYRIYDYANDMLSKPLTKIEANKAIREIYKASLVSETGQDVQDATKQNASERQAQELDTFARENIPDYKKLVGAQQQAVRQTLRQARAANISEADQILYGRVAARSGAIIEFVSESDLRRGDKVGDAGYSMENGKILVNRNIANNPNARTAAKIILHEFTHSIFGAKHTEIGTIIRNPKAYNSLYAAALKALSYKQQADILSPYIDGRVVKGQKITMQDFLNGKVDFSRDDYIELREELAANFVERELGSAAALKRLISDKPSFKDRLLSFLKKANKDYAGDEKLSRAAKALLKKYQKFFNAQVTQNRFSSTITDSLAQYKNTEQAQTPASDGARLVIKKDTDGNEYVEAQSNITNGTETSKVVADTLAQIVRTKFSDLVDVHGQRIGIKIKTAREWLRSKSADALLHTNNQAYLDKINAFENADELLQASRDYVGEAARHARKDSFVEFARGIVAFKVGERGYEADIIVGTTKSGAAVLYDIVNIQGKNIVASESNTEQFRRSNSQATNNSISENQDNVNQNRRKNGKKRYALSIGGENVAVDVQEEGNLVALHNLSEQSLLKVLKLGGFPMPSIAITKADIPFTDFGDITIVFGRETIDPANPDNVVYGRDAWTPTVPRAEYKLNTAKAQEISSRISPYISEYETLCGSSNVRLDTDAMQDYLNGWDGQIAYQYGDKFAMQYAFLRDTGVLWENITERGADLNSIIDSETDTRRKAYNEWLDKLFDGITERKGVRNNADAFNRAGQRRSFEETHYDYTLENIVKVMRTATPQGGVDSYASTDTLAAALAKNFSSIEDIRQAESLLSAKNQKEIAAARNEYEKAITEIVDSMAGRTTIELSTGAEEALLELARSKRTSPMAILTYLQKEYKGIYKFDISTAQKISTLFQALGAMETDMFEAKPRRAVALSEIKQVLIPSRTPNQELLQALRENNVPFTLYDRSFDNNTDERTAIIKRLGGVRFALAQDADYMAAVKSGDTKGAQNIIEAAAKKAGYTERVYHGTQAFGFTAFDTSMSDDGISIFVTSTQEMAGTYAATNAVRNLEERHNIPKPLNESMSNAELAKAANAVSEVTYKSLSEAEIYQKQADKDCVQAFAYARSLKTLGFIEDFAEQDVPLGSPVGNTAYLVGIVQELNDLMSSKEQNNPAVWKDIAARAEKVYRQEMVEPSASISNYMLSLQRTLHSMNSEYRDGLFGIERQDGSYYTYLTREDLIESVNENITLDYASGIYSLYAKPQKQLVIDGKGRYWKNIPITDEMAKEIDVRYFMGYSGATTRQIARWAKNHGYDSVKFQNIYDDGGLGDRVGSPAAADVSVYFDEKLLKSADAVVYDDNGRVIPPSERFDSKKSDIRFALADTDSEGRKLTAAQIEYFNGTKVVDKDGKLLTVYHQTNSVEYVNKETGQRWSQLDWKEKAAWEEKSNAEWNRVWKKQDFYVFDNERGRRSIEMPAFFFSPEYDQYHEYGERTIEAYLLMRNPAYNPVIEDAGKTNTAGEKAMQRLIEQGYDGFVRTDDEGYIYEYAVFDSSQIKEVSNKKPTTNADIRYALSDTDSMGRTLTPEQEVFFRKSKVRDDKGNLLVVYHGTPRGGFTVFETEYDGAYFTTDRQYAAEYARDAKGGGNSQVYEGYLNIERPFDTRNAADRKLFYDEFYKKWGNGTDLQAKGLPDWTDGSDLVEFLKGRGYDGMLIDEGGVPDGKGGVRDRGISYVIFDSSQFKNADNSAPASSKDIRFALTDKTDTTGRKLTKKQREFFQNTVAVDDGGKLRVEYHGTNAQFYTFRNQGQNSRQMYGVGFYFTPYQDEAAAYGKRIIQAYLNVQQPIIFGEKHITEAQWAQYLDFCKEHASEYVEGVWKGNPITAFDYRDVIDAKSDNVLVSDFVNHIAGGSGDVAVSYLRMLKDSLGYDGIQRGDYLIAFTPEQIKQVSNTAPTTSTDIRYALQQPPANNNADPNESDNSGAIGGLTRGQRAKFVANNTRFKVYSKSDAASVIDSIIAERLSLDNGRYAGELSGKSRAEVIEKLFIKLNNTPEGYRLGVALDIADYIIDNAVLTDMYDTFSDDSWSMYVLSTLRKYMHNMDLRGIQGEIRYKFDRKNSINLIWGTKEGGSSPDQVAMELEELGIHIEAINEADQFFEMLDIYENAKAAVNRKAETIMLTAYGNKTEVENLRQQIARDVLLAYDEKGSPSKYAKLVEQYTKRIADLKQDLSTAYRRNTLINRIIDGAAYLRDIATRRNYVGADVFSAPELTQWLKQLSKLKYRSDLRKSGARKILLDYGAFYNTNNTLLYDENPDLNYIDNNVLDALSLLRQNALSTKPLSIEELQAAQVIIASAKHLFNNYDQVIMEGKKQRITDLATQGNEIIQKSKNRTDRTFFNKIYGLFNKIIEPRVVIESLENFNPNGVLTRAYAEITRAETESGLLYIELTNDIDTYIKQHKRFRKRLSSEYINVAGAELTVGQAISLYELSKRPQAQEGLYEAGFSYVDRKGSTKSVRVTEAEIAEMAKSFTETDKGFIDLVETFFNVLSKQVKTDADMQILGYTNTSDEFYFPIKRDSGTIAKNITDARSIMADWANVYNFSFNKDVKTGAKNQLFVTSVYDVVTRHAKQLSTYAKMTVPLKNFSQIYSKNIGDKTNVISIRNTVNKQVWGGAESYLSKLFSDIQGRAGSNSLIEKMRGAYAKYQLGANAKVIISQITSYPTAGVLLDFSSLSRGFVMRTNWQAMDKHCPYARVRNYERGIVRAEGVVDKVGKVGDVLTKPIQWTDRFTIGRLWNACQLQVQKDANLKVGTVENMEKAGALLEDVIRLTQPNYTNTERSELMRSDSDIVRTFTMFTSVPLKQLSRLVESFGEYNALRSLVKSGEADAATQARYKVAKRKVGRVLASVTVANLMYVLVGQFFKFLYNDMAEDDEEGKVTAKSFFLDMLKDFGSTTIGMFPVVRDIYSAFVDGYDIDSFSADMLNSIIGSTKQLFELATKAASGEEVKTQDYMLTLRNSLYGIGQITGIPVRNINNTITGLIKRFSPSAAYSYTSLFYNPKYSADIKAALKKGDYDLAQMVMGMMLKDDRTGELSKKATQKLIELYDGGYTVLPKTIGDTVTYEGTEIQLSASQKSAFKAIYSQVNGQIENLVNSIDFATLSAEQQAKAIKSLYDAYYNKALYSLANAQSSNQIVLLSAALPPSSLAVYVSAISEIESDTDKTGKVISGSKKAKVIKYIMGRRLSTPQKLLLILGLGYTIKDGDIRGISAAKAKATVAKYITTLHISKAEKTALAEKCGLTVKNGRIYTT